MRCFTCGGELGPSELMNLPFRSLPGVLLVNIPGQRCSTCGDVEYEIPRIEDLIRVVVEQVVRKQARLTGAEVRFLRKSLGWSSGDLAMRLSVSPSTVSRWESGSQVIGPVPDKLLRMFVIHERPIDDYNLELMRSTATADPVPVSCAFQLHDLQWASYVMEVNARPETAVHPAVVVQQREHTRAARS